MSFGRSLRRTQAKNIGPLEVKATPAAFGVAPYKVGKPYRDHYQMDRAVQVQQRVTWVFSAVHAIAKNQAKLNMLVRSEDSETGPIQANHPLVPIYNRRANSVEDSHAFRYTLSTQILLSPRGAFVEIIRDNLDRVAGLALLPPGYTSPIPSQTDFVSGYIVEIPGVETPRTLPPEDVLWVKLPHPTDRYAAQTPLSAAGLSAEADYAARMFNRNFMLNDATPGGIMVIKGDLDADDMQELRAREQARRGPGGAGKTAYINAEDVEFINTSTTPRDAQYHEARMDAKDEILVAFGVPECVLGRATDSTFANADVEKESFWEETMVPHLEIISRAFDTLDPTGTLYTAFNLDAVPALQRAKTAQKASDLSDVEKGTLTIDEYRVKWGLEPLGFDKPRGLSNWVALDNELPVAPTPIHVINQAQPQALPAAGDTTEPPVDAEVVPAKGVELALELKADPWTKIRFGSITMDAKAADELRATNARRLKSWESSVAGIMRGVFARQEKAVLAKLTSRKVRMQFDGDPRRASPVAGTKTIDPGSIFDKKTLDAQLISDAQDFVEAIMDDFGGDIAKKLDVGWDVHNPLVTKAITEQVNRLAGVNQTTYDSITNQLAQGEQVGESIDKLAERVKGVFSVASSSRAETIARTEVVAAANSGSMAAATDSGVVATKVWLAASDDRVRPDHADADGQEVGLDEQFDVGGEAMDYPGDPNGSAEQVVNCFPAGTLVASPSEIIGGIRRMYEGPMVKLGLSNGETLSVTPNHPLLTSAGWKAAGLVEEGDDLVNAVPVKRAPGGGPDPEDGPAKIEETIGALAVLGDTRRVVGADVDLHGEVPDGEVEVVALDRELRPGGQARGAGGEGDLVLVPADHRLLSRSGGGSADGPATDGLGPVALAPARIVGSTGQGAPLIPGQLAHPHPVRIASATRLDAKFQEAATDRGATDLVALGELELGGTCEVSLSKVTQRDVYAFAGHVHTLQTSTGWYIANSVVVRNCRCTLVYGVTPDEAGTTDDSDVVDEAGEGA